MTITQNPTVVRPSGGQPLLCHPTYLTFKRLNPTALALWSLLARPATTTDLVEWSARTYELPRAVAERDIQEFVADLFRDGFLRECE